MAEFNKHIVSCFYNLCRDTITTVLPRIKFGEHGDIQETQSKCNSYSTPLNFVSIIIDLELIGYDRNMFYFVYF